MKKSPIVAAATVAIVIGTTVAVTSAVNASTSSASSTGDSHRAKPVRIEVFAPERGANAGASGFGWFVDMEVDFLGMNLQQAGFSGLQLTGPGVHTNAPPFPGAFSTGQDDRLPGLVVLTSFISPFRAERAMARALLEEGEFVEVHVDTPLDVAEQRDTKGLYAKARRGELKDFTGIDSPYEAPDSPEIRVDTTSMTPEEAAEQVVAHLRAHGVLR